MAARSVDEGRKAAFFVPLVLMPVAACVVASGGWVGKALGNAGILPAEMDPAQVFFYAAEFLCTTPGLFGLIMASLTAALMSTVDTLITAIAAIVVNDIYQPYINQNASDSELLKVARLTSVGVTLFGIALVPAFMTFGSIYEAHGAFTAAITPPLVITLLCAVFWRRFTSRAALATLSGGIGAIIVSIAYPEVITPFAHGIAMADVSDSLFVGAKQYKYIRAFYGLTVSGVIAVVVTYMSKPEPLDRIRGLVWGTIGDAVTQYKGSPGKEQPSTTRSASIASLGVPDQVRGDARLSEVTLSAGLADELGAAEGDLVYVSDARWWLGGLMSSHVIVGAIDSEVKESRIWLGMDSYGLVVKPGRESREVSVERLY